MQQKYLIGTLFEEEEQNKKMNLANMKAKDPQGNTRWKGAFHGGFEAGYGNTCGSKQGWAPSTFVSSVFNRAEKKQQNIFDYMDKQDLGRESIAENISLNQKFSTGAKDSLNISRTDSIGQRILSKMKKEEAHLNAPEDLGDLHKLLQKYEKNELIEETNYDLLMKGTKNYESVGSLGQNIPDDDFIVAYDDLFRKVIRANAKEQTQQEIRKRRQENKIYFEFTKPLQQEPEYLKEIQQIQEISKPKKRKKNILNEQKLKDIFKFGSSFRLNLNESVKNKSKNQIPQNYDPYHRIKNLKQKEKQFIVGTQERKKPKIFKVSQRSDVLGQGKLQNKFRSGSMKNNNFMRASQEEKEYEKIFDDDDKKNTRYWDYVHELEGKKISAQLQNIDFEEAEKEKKEFERIYKLKKEFPEKVEETLKKQNKKDMVIVRKTGTWRPERALCKRFNLTLPYKLE